MWRTGRSNRIRLLKLAEWGEEANLSKLFGNEEQLPYCVLLHHLNFSARRVSARNKFSPRNHIVSLNIRMSFPGIPGASSVPRGNAASQNEGDQMMVKQVLTMVQTRPYKHCR